MSEQFVNKVAQSGIITLNLEDYYPKGDIKLFDMKDFLFMELILKEKDFREALRQIDLSPYDGKVVALTCSNDAIIPVWAYMLVASLLEPVAKEIIFGDEAFAAQSVLIKNITAINKEMFNDQRVVVKGCGDLPIKEAAYIEITKQLRPFAKSIMYGEPCSTVPVFKKSIKKDL